jgi:hypothetical protein
MTAENTGAPGAQWNLERINRLVSDLEQELARAPAHPDVERMRAELEVLRGAINAQTGRAPGEVGEEHIESARSSFQRMTATVENEVWRDSPFITEIGRILGMV